MTNVTQDTLIMLQKTPIPHILSEKQARPPLSDSASALAPFLYFEDITAIGHANGVIRMTLEAQRLISTSDNDLEVERVIVAHLRMNLAAAMSLKAAIEKAFLLAVPPRAEA